jgi:hypothetical protein
MISIQKMDKRFLNVRSEFVVGDTVNVTRNETGEKFQGVVSFLEMAPINRAIKDGDHTEYIYVKFEDRSAYSSWLSRGSAIMIQRKYKSVQKYVVCKLNGEYMTAIHDAGGYLMNVQEDEFSPNDIDSMLIWRVAYTIDKI